MTLLRLEYCTVVYSEFIINSSYGISKDSLGHLWVLPILVCDGFIFSPVDLVFGAVHLSHVDHGQPSNQIYD